MDELSRTAKSLFHQLSPEDWPVTASLYYYTITTVLATILRSLTKRLFPSSSNIYVLDLITTFQFCACSLENGNVRFYHGYQGFALALLGLGILYNLTFQGVRGNPLGNFADAVEGKDRKSVV